MREYPHHKCRVAVDVVGYIFVTHDLRVRVIPQSIWVVAEVKGVKLYIANIAH